MLMTEASSGMSDVNLLCQVTRSINLHRNLISRNIAVKHDNSLLSITLLFAFLANDDSDTFCAIAALEVSFI